MLWCSSEFGEPPEVREVPDPCRRRGGAVIRVEATGLCRSDWHGWMGHDPDIRLPHVPGHELAGVIEAVGAGVADWRPGDRVTVPFVCACGRCAGLRAPATSRCASGRPSPASPTGARSPSTWRVRPRRRQPGRRCPSELSFATAARARLPLRHRVPRRGAARAGSRPGEWVAVHGCGGVGLSAVMIAAACGARVVAVDVSPGALELARTFGAAVCVDASRTDRTRRRGRPGARPAAARTSRSTPWARRDLRRLGHEPAPPAAGTCRSACCPQRRPTPVPMDRVDRRWSWRLLGSHGMAAHAYPEMMAMVAAGALRPDLLVTTAIGLDDVPAALAALGGASGTGVTVITPHPAVNSA